MSSLQGVRKRVDISPSRYSPVKTEEAIEAGENCKSLSGRIIWVHGDGCLTSARDMMFVPYSDLTMLPLRLDEPFLPGLTMPPFSEVRPLLCESPFSSDFSIVDLYREYLMRAA